MPLITATFLILTNLFTTSQGIIKRSLNQIGNTAISYTRIKIVHDKVHHIVVLCQNANGQIGTHIYQVPVWPIMQRTIIRSLMVIQKIFIFRCKYIYYPSLKISYIICAPTFISLHNFCSIGKCISLTAGSKHLICIIRSNTLAHISPCIQNFNWKIRIFYIACQLP